jgi:hypothetical protein
MAAERQKQWNQKRCPLLDNGQSTCVRRNQHTRNDRETVGSGVFYVVAFEAI